MPRRNRKRRKKAKIDDEKCQVFADAIEALTRQLFPAIRSYFEIEEGQAEFAEWQTPQHAEQSTGWEMKPGEQVGRTEKQKRTRP
jgi:hypothetical protein